MPPTPKPKLVKVQFRCVESDFEALKQYYSANYNEAIRVLIARHVRRLHETHSQALSESTSEMQELSVDLNTLMKGD